MESILKKFVAEDGDTKGKLLGAAFVAVNRQGKRLIDIVQSPFHSH